MRVRLLLPVCLLLWSLCARGQGTAVVIGIADFQDPAVTDLRYADDDAHSFANYLTAPDGGGLPTDRVRLLTDSTATLAAIQSALAWQLATSTPESPAYLYLATHGDVETSDPLATGYLLAHDTPYNNYNLLALSVSYLDEHVTALAAKGVTPVVISDACHAGTLAGDAVAGRRLTAARLMQRRAGEIRMLACQPYELSQEGTRWGGGHGAFSYHLLEGIRGAADENRDRRIDLLELERYVQDLVSADTDRQQHPEVFGGRKHVGLFTVASEQSTDYLTSRTEALQADFLESTLALAPPETQRDYLRFRRAVHAGALLYPEERSALAYYRKLRSEPSLTAVRGLLDERLTVVLLDSVQQAIRAYLATDAQELLQRERLDDKYRHFAAYLALAGEILGVEDPRYPAIAAKRAYFEGLVLRLGADNGSREARVYREALPYLERAVTLEPAAAYLHNELGLLQLRLRLPTEAYYSFQRAIALAPTWALPYNNLASMLGRIDPQVYGDSSQIRYRIATRLKPDFASAYMNWGNLMLALGRPDTAETLLRQSIALAPEYVDPVYNLAFLLHQQAERAEAAIPLFRGLIDRGGYPADCYLGLARVYRQQQQRDSAEANIQRALGLHPDNPTALAWLREYAQETDQPELASSHLTALLATQPDLAVAYLELMLLDTTDGRWLRQLRRAPLDDSTKAEVATRLSTALFGSQQRAAAESALRLAVRSRPRAGISYLNLAAFYAASTDEPAALKALRDGFRIAGDEGDVSTFCAAVSANGNVRALLRSAVGDKLYQTHCGGLPPPD